VRIVAGEYSSISRATARRARSGLALATRGPSVASTHSAPVSSHVHDVAPKIASARSYFAIRRRRACVSDPAAGNSLASPAVAITPTTLYP